MKVFEGLSDTVYHFTGLKQATEILMKDEFKLSPSFASDVEGELSEKLWYLSTTRSRLGSYHKSDIFGVLFQLDGRKLNSISKGKSIDYWGKLSPDSDEMEDRLITDTATIPSNKFIEKVEVLVAKNSTDDVQEKFAKFIYMYCKKNTIPVVVYNDRIGLKTRNLKYTYSHSEIMNFAKNHKVDRSPTYSDKSDARRKLNRYSYFYGFMEMYYAKDKDDMSDDAKKVYRDIMNSPDAFRIIQAEIKNHSSANVNDPKNFVEKFSVIMKKERVRNVKQLVDKLKSRYRKIEHDASQKRIIDNAWKRYHDNPKQMTNLINAYGGEGEFNRELFPENEQVAMMLIDQLTSALIEIDMLPFEAYGRWIDESTGTIEPIAFEFLFKFDLEY